MKYVLSICTMAILSMPAYGQQAGHRDQIATRRLGENQQIRQDARTQVDLQLRMVEVSLTKLRRLGLDPAKLADDSDSKANVAQTNGDPLTFSVSNDGGKAGQFLDSLRQDSLAKVLAEPTLATLSGRTAVFNLGEMLAVPKSQQDGSVMIERQHAIVIKVASEVSGDKVRLEIHGRITELDHKHMVRIGDKTVPGVRVREFNTRTELRSGQTLMISGLTQTRVEAVNRGMPYVSEVPYVGAIFRSVEEERNDIARFIQVRPQIVQSPAVAGSPQTGSEDDVSTPQAVPSVNVPDDSSSATARRLSDGDIQQ